ncbi:MAG: endoribonuclease MazF [Burkholderiaceae bacterium]
MGARAYVPDAGDVVWLAFGPQAGREQAGRRPALVMSPAIYNRKSDLMLCCPLSTRVKGYPFEVAVSIEGQDGVVLSDQVKSLDWRVRRARRMGCVPPSVMLEVRARIKALLAIP